MLALTGCAAAIPVLQSGAAALAAHASAAPLAAAAGAAAVGVGVGVAASDDIKRLAQDVRDSPSAPPIPNTLGAFFHDGNAAAQSLVQTAMRSQRDAQIVAGLQAQAALAKGRVLFRDSLKQKLGELAEPASRYKAEMESVLPELASESDATVKAAGERAQASAARLRLATDIPQVRPLGPLFLFPSLPSQSITIRGAFPSAYARESVPELSVNGKTYKTFDAQPDSLRFVIPTADFDAAEPRETVWKTAELRVPWSRPVFNVATSTELSKFSIVMGVLPQSFGSLVVEKTAARVRAEEKPRLSGDFQINPDAGGAGESRCLRLTGQELADGWRIRPGSGAVVRDPRGGEPDERWNDLGMQSESDRALCWKVSAPPGDESDAGERGRLAAATWKISARIVREVSETSVASESVDLAWGSRHSFQVAAGAWKLRYARQGGAERSLASADTSNPLIRVQADASGVLQVSVYPF